MAHPSRLSQYKSNNIRREKRVREILQGLRVAQAAVTERWPPAEKTSEKSTFFLKKIKITYRKYFFFHISSSYAKILGEKLFRTWEIPRSGSKAKDGERKEERLNDGNNNGQATHGARKHAWRTQAAWAKIQISAGRFTTFPKFYHF